MSLKLHYALDFLMVFAFFSIVYALRVRKRQRWYKLIFCLTAIYISLVLFVTLMPFQPIRLSHWDEIGRYNLIPFADITLHHLGAKREAVLNVFMFMPLGFLLPELKKKGFFAILLTGFFSSLAVECTQLLYGLSGAVYGRSFDVTDLITNTLGSALGYFIWLIMRPLSRRISEKIN